MFLKAVCLKRNMTFQKCSNFIIAITYAFLILQVVFLRILLSPASLSSFQISFLGRVSFIIFFPPTNICCIHALHSPIRLSLTPSWFLSLRSEPGFNLLAFLPIFIRVCLRFIATCASVHCLALFFLNLRGWLPKLTLAGSFIAGIGDVLPLHCTDGQCWRSEGD